MEKTWRFAKKKKWFRKKIVNGTIASRIPSVMQRQTDQETFRRIEKEVLNKSIDKSIKLDRIGNIFDEHEPVSSLLEKLHDREEIQVNVGGDKTVVGKLQLAKYLTVGDCIREREEREKQKVNRVRKGKTGKGISKAGKKVCHVLDHRPRMLFVCRKSLIPG